MGTWMNNDGLYIKLGATEATHTTGGEYNMPGPVRIEEVDVDLTLLGSSSAIIDDSIMFPAGAFIEYVEVVNRVAATGSGATLNLGLVRKDRTTAIDVDGLLVTAPITDWNAAGETLRYTEGVTGHGALIGTKLAYTGYLVADYDTAAFSAGEVTIRIAYSFNNQD